MSTKQRMGKGSLTSESTVFPMTRSASVSGMNRPNIYYSRWLLKLLIELLLEIRKPFELMKDANASRSLDRVDRITLKSLIKNK